MRAPRSASSTAVVGPEHGPVAAPPAIWGLLRVSLGCKACGAGSRQGRITPLPCTGRHSAWGPPLPGPVLPEAPRAMKPQPAGPLAAIPHPGLSPGSGDISGTGTGEGERVAPVSLPRGMSRHQNLCASFPCTSFSQVTSPPITAPLVAMRFPLTVTGPHCLFVSPGLWGRPLPSQGPGSHCTVKDFLPRSRALPCLSRPTAFRKTNPPKGILALFAQHERAPELPGAPHPP